MNIDTKRETFIQVVGSFYKSCQKVGLLPSCHSDPPAGRNAECAAFERIPSYGRTDRGRPEVGVHYAHRLEQPTGTWKKN